MGHPHRISSSAAARLGRGTTLASNGWRARVALASLLRELRGVSARGMPVSGAIAGAGWLARLRRLVRRLSLTIRFRGGRDARRAMTVTAPWQGVAAANTTLPRLHLADQEPRRYAGLVAQRAEAELGDVDALLPMLGDIRTEDLEIALRVVRRVRALTGAA